MRIADKYKQGRPVLSFEIFPPKKDDDMDALTPVLAALAAQNPDFVSVTCGAGGTGGRNKTITVASMLKKDHGIEPMAHLTCITSDKAEIANSLAEAEAAGVSNILALRGDIPDGYDIAGAQYRYAKDLVADIKAQSGVCIAAAAYPEGHIDCADDTLSMEHLKQKQDAGAEFFVTQLCFDNEYILRFRESAVKAGITAPISVGIMPMMSKAQISRMIFMCGASLPSKMIKLLHQYENDADGLLKAGMEYAGDQIEGLIRAGVDGVHMYSMNKPQIAEYGMSRARAAL
uniref:Methylenetetrahydrofolate reductase n=1 Tax=uncultured Bacillota bacterium TaxID=344338 RepID=A0A650EP91_9FIRM|nr:methylenetetrahydrofolate reductase [uncultured Firmicutes bacterium]